MGIVKKFYTEIICLFLGFFLIKKFLFNNSYLDLSFLNLNFLWVKVLNDFLSILVLNVFMYKNLLDNFLFKLILYKYSFKIIGLGFRIYWFSSYIFRFFFGLGHYIYVHRSRYIYYFFRQKRLVFVSFFNSLLISLVNTIKKLKLLSYYFKGIKAKGTVLLGRLVFKKVLKTFFN